VAEFIARTVVAQPKEVVFDFVSDHRNVRPILEGVTRWELLDEAPGAGARYRVEMSLVGLSLGDVLVVTEWNPPKSITFENESPVAPVRGRWTFIDDPRGCLVQLRITYRLPGGWFGAVVSRRLEEILRTRIDAAMVALRTAIEGSV
jgi:uncharacterized membrane protein